MIEELTDPSAERAVLGGILQHGQNAYIDAFDIVNVDTFTIDSNQVIWKCIKHIFSDEKTTDIDLPSIYSAATELKCMEVFQRPNEKEHLRAIFNFRVAQSNVRKFALKIRKLHIARSLINELEEAKKTVVQIDGSESIDHILSLAEKPILQMTTELSGHKHKGPELIGKGIIEYLDYLADNPIDNPGLSTGYGLFDAAIGGGLRRGTINLVGARPKIGKTMMAENVGIHVAGTLNLPVLFLDTEMRKEDHNHRNLASISKVETNLIETGKFAQNPHQKIKVYDAAKKYENMPLRYVNIVGYAFEEILSIARRWIVKDVGYDDNGETKDCLIIYDYFKMMSTDDLQGIQEHQALGFQISALHNFLVDYDAPCFALIQLNRDGITKEDTDTASGSDRLVWLCSNFSLFKKKAEEEIAEDGPENGNRKMVQLVARHGKGLDDGDYINMNFAGHIGTITELNTRNSLRHNNNEAEFHDDFDTDQISFSE